MSATRKVKRSEGNGENEDNDRLHKLPDAMLGHILSFLPIEDAVRTSLLSRKWRYKWTLITHLHFSDVKLFEVSKKKRNNVTKMFPRFVERVLLLVGSSTIEKIEFELYSQDHDPDQISKWILAAMRRDSRIVKFICASVKSLTFPCITCWSASLVELVIIAECSIRVFSSISFSNLVVLKLNRVRFMNISYASNSSTSVNDFYISCTALKLLELVDCQWKSGSSVRTVPTLKIKAPELDVFTVHDSEYGVINEGDDYCTTACIFMMNVPKLTTLKSLGGYTVPSIILQDTSVIVSLHVEPKFAFYNLDKLSDKFVRLLRTFSSAKQLKVSSNIFKHDIHLSKLNNLIQIEISYADVDEKLMTFLHCAPFLETLIFGKCLTYKRIAEVLGMFPRSILSHLEVVQFNDKFLKSDDLFELAKYFLNCAMVLKKLIISCHVDTKSMKQLLEFTRCSSSASILFVN